MSSIKSTGAVLILHDMTFGQPLAPSIAPSANTPAIVIMEGEDSITIKVITSSLGTTAAEVVIETRTPHEESADASLQKRIKQIDAYALRGQKKTKSKDAWLKLVGKYPDDSPMNRILDEGAKIREAERIEQC